MAVNINWLLKQKEMEGFKLLAGNTKRQVPITGINIMDNPDTIPWLTKGTAVLSTGYFLTDKELQATIIESLAKKECSCLGIKMNRYLDELPDIMVKQAEEYNFPIVSIPYDSSMDQIANIIYHRLYQQEMSEAEKISTLYRELTESLLKRRNLTSLVKILSDFFNQTAFLTNDAFEVQAYSMPKEDTYSFPYSFSKDSYTIFSESDIIYLHNKITQEEHPLYRHTIANTPLSFTIFPLKDRNTVIGFLILLQKEDNINSDIHNIINNVASILSLALISNNVLTESQRSNKEVFFNSILSDKYTSREDIEPLCRQNNFDFNKNRICLALGIKEYEKMTIPKKRAFEKKTFTAIKNNIALNEEKLITTAFQGYLIIFILLNNEDSQQIISNYAQNLSQKILEILSNENISCKIGVSKASKGALTISQSHKEAQQALELGMQITPEKNIFSYYENQVYHLLINNFTNKQLHTIFNEYLGAVMEYDAENNGNLTETLYKYINNALNITQTAKELYIHRNTMFYRLEQIKKLLLIDFENTENIYKIQTAFYIKKILNL